ncbi:MAG: hypothetical protein ACLU94_07855, partial [Catenibacillus sp.]
NPFQTEAETVHQKSFVLLSLSDSFHIISSYSSYVNTFFKNSYKIFPELSYPYINGKRQGDHRPCLLAVYSD